MLGKDKRQENMTDEAEGESVECQNPIDPSIC